MCRSIVSLLLVFLFTSVSLSQEDAPQGLTPKPQIATGDPPVHPDAPAVIAVPVMPKADAIFKKPSTVHPMKTLNLDMRFTHAELVEAHAKMFDPFDYLVDAITMFLLCCGVQVFVGGLTYTVGYYCYWTSRIHKRAFWISLLGSIFCTLRLGYEFALSYRAIINERIVAWDEVNDIFLARDPLMPESYIFPIVASSFVVPLVIFLLAIYFFRQQFASTEAERDSNMRLALGISTLCLLATLSVVLGPLFLEEPVYPWSFTMWIVFAIGVTFVYSVGLACVQLVLSAWHRLSDSKDWRGGVELFAVLCLACILPATAIGQHSTEYPFPEPDWQKVFTQIDEETEPSDFVVGDAGNSVEDGESSDTDSYVQDKLEGHADFAHPADYGDHATDTLDSRTPTYDAKSLPLDADGMPMDPYAPTLSSIAAENVVSNEVMRRKVRMMLSIDDAELDLLLEKNDDDLPRYFRSLHCLYAILGTGGGLIVLFLGIMFWPKVSITFVGS